MNYSRLHTSHHNLIINYLKLSKVSVDKVGQFGLIPPELRGPLNKMGEYLHWFATDKAKVQVGKFPEKTLIDLSMTCWMDFSNGKYV